MEYEHIELHEHYAIIRTPDDVRWIWFDIEVANNDE